MTRWNGWGDVNIRSPLKNEAKAFLQETLGEGRAKPDATLKTIAERVPKSRLQTEHRLITTDAEDRIKHATGQSLPDWVAKRSGEIPAFPDGIAYPMNATDVRSLIDYAQSHDVKLIPYGGGTSVVGHINPQKNDLPVLTVDMRRMNALRGLDPVSQIATFGAGVDGPQIEARLRAQGFTLGHFPQSFEYSTLGGWVATRSSGQQSLHYGRIEQLFTGGSIETPTGTLDMPAIPASAAGPDLREIVLGSEGRMGIITEASVRISRLPELETFRGVFFPDFESATNAARAITQARIPLSMMRLSNPVETLTNLTMAGHKRAIGIMERYLQVRNIDNDKCMLIIGATGRKSVVSRAVKEAMSIAREYKGVNIGALLGNQWKKNRFRGAYLRNTLWDHGYGVDTLETSVTWDKTITTMNDIESALKQTSAEQGEPVHVFSHLSHVYTHGSSIYTTYVFKLGETPQDTIKYWQAMKHSASQAIVKNGGTISHQHGVGVDHMPYLHAEKGETGINALASIIKHFDPDNIMNPGKLINTANEAIRHAYAE